MQLMDAELMGAATPTPELVELEVRCTLDGDARRDSRCVECGLVPYTYSMKNRSIPGSNTHTRYN